MAIAKEINTSIEEQLRALIRLQHIDNKLDQIDQLRGDLPEEIRDLEDERMGLETRIEKIKQQYKEVQRQRKQSALDIREAEALIKKYDDQQMHVRNNREYDALTKELETQKQRIVAAKRHIEETEGTSDEQDAAILEAQERLKDLATIIKERRAQLQEVFEETKQREEELRGFREKAKQFVDGRYMRAYRGLRKRFRDGRAVVMLERGAAAGFAVTLQRQVEIRQHKRIVACESTGRIIVDKELYERTVNDLGI